MARHSNIEWTDSTWNPFLGCSRVSEGCRLCYAERFAARFSKPGQHWAGYAASRHGEARWTGAVGFDLRHRDDPLHWQEQPHEGRRLVFVNAMSDTFHEKIPEGWRDELFAVMMVAEAVRPGTIFQVLTKRPLIARQYMITRSGLSMLPLVNDVRLRLDLPPIAWGPGQWMPLRWPPRNVWLGVSAEDQATADERIPVLLDTPAQVRWLSAEPLLGPLELSPRRYVNAAIGLDWVVIGGESGPGCRPMDLEWARQILRDCEHADVPVFLKQLGGWPDKRGGEKAVISFGDLGPFGYADFPRAAVGAG